MRDIFKKSKKIDAIVSLSPGAQVSQRGEEIIWHDGNPNNITEEQIDTKLSELTAEYDALAYARDRKFKYPLLDDFIEAYTEKEIGGNSAKWDAYVINYDKVRTENPK